MKKKFLIIGNINAVLYKDIFESIKKKKIFVGSNGRIKKFISDNNIKDKSQCIFYTNLKDYNSKSFYNLNTKYDETENQKYDNYNAINVNSSKKIPKDYFEEMGVPISFIEHINFDQFEIIDMLNVPLINNEYTYKRLIIKRKQ